jgi:hypothetical protein
VHVLLRDCVRLETCIYRFLLVTQSVTGRALSSWIQMYVLCVRAFARGSGSLVLYYALKY